MKCLPSCADVLHRPLILIISGTFVSRGRQTNVRTCKTHVQSVLSLLFLLIKPILFVVFSLPLPSSLLKLLGDSLWRRATARNARLRIFFLWWLIYLIELVVYNLF